MDTVTVTGLVLTAAFLGVVHTLTGPDHYLPFIAMSRIGRWSPRKTIAITLACGVGHVLSSVLLGGVGIAAGIAVTRLEGVESARGALAGWLLVGFGLAYAVWGLRRAVRHRPHSHVHAHTDGVTHAHEHNHLGVHTHVHHHERKAASMTPWILFTIFVFGPCEPLIPVLMFPAATLSVGGVALVAGVFGVTTLATMTVVVVGANHGLNHVRFPGLQRYGHVAAGLALTACGAAVTLGL